MSHKIKTSALYALILAMMLLTGCSGVRDHAQQEILKRSGIPADEDYQQYLEYDEEGMLDTDGYYDGYILDFDLDEDEDKGTIGITFASNNFLLIEYYEDEARTLKIDTSDCFMNPGDAIYASDPVILNQLSDLYRLSGYRITEYDEDGEQIDTFMKNVSDDGLVFTIPGDFKGSRISILPIGEYPDRKLRFSVYRTGDDGEPETLYSAGSWYVNGQLTRGSSRSISAIIPYTVEFDFDKDDYFYVSADPTPFTVNLSDSGKVQFSEVQPTKGISDFSVELCPYLSLSIWFHLGGNVSVNDKEIGWIFIGGTWTVDNLRYGDTITIETEGRCMLTDGDINNVRAVEEETDSGCRYVLTIVPASDPEGKLPDGITVGSPSD